MLRIPTLKIPSFEPNDYFVLQVDASSCGAGSCLYQAIHDSKGDPKLQLIGYYSKAFKNSQKRTFCSFDNELQGLRLSLKFFHALVYGSQTTKVLSDNSGVCEILKG